MNRTTALSTAGIAILAASALALGAVAPASAHTGALFTVIPGTSPSFTPQFAAMATTDGALSPVGSQLDFVPVGLEIYEEEGYTVGRSATGTFIAPWDHSTGAVGTRTPLTTEPGFELWDVWGLDITPDGTILAIIDGMNLFTEFGDFETWVASIDPVTGELTQLIDLTGASVFADSIATDPVSGTTYVFLGPQLTVTTLDLQGRTYSPPVTYPGITTALGAGYLEAADFDAAGTLWFYYGGDSRRTLASTTGSFAPSVGAVVHASNLGVDTYVLTVDPAAPVTPGPAVPGQVETHPPTGLDSVGTVALAVVLTAVGGVVLAAGRRRAA